MTSSTVVGSVSAALGAGIVICVLGVPLLWTPEAAGWASAIGTTAAVAVALYLGFLPHTGRKRLASSVGIIVYSRLWRQQLHLLACERLTAERPMDSHLFRFVRETLLLDPRFADELVPYFDVLTDAQASAVAAAVADLEAMAPLLVVDEHMLGFGLELSEAQRIGRQLAPVTMSLERARQRLAPFANRSPAQDLEPAVADLVSGCIDMAKISRNSKQMRS
jgi:hypothetical protein